MAFGVSPKVSHDISSAFGKGLQGLKVEAMETPQKGVWKGISGRALLESALLGVFTITIAALPVLVTRVPTPESLLTVMEILQDWCTPSICFMLLIVGVLVATSGVWGSDSGGLSTPEQNHKMFSEAYLTAGPVPATQINPLRMPDIFFSAEAARAQSAAFAVRMAAQPTSAMAPVYYSALVPPQAKEIETGEQDVPRHFESNGGEIFVDDEFGGDRFASRVEDNFPPRLEERFSPESFVISKGEERFGPRVEDRFSPDRFANLHAAAVLVPQAQETYPQAKAMYVPDVQELYPEVDKRYASRLQELYAEVENRYVPQAQELYPEMEEGYESRVREPYSEVEEGYESHEHDHFSPEEDACEHEAESPGYVESSRYDHPHLGSQTRPDDDDDETRSDSGGESRYAPVSTPIPPEEEPCERDDLDSEPEELAPQVFVSSDVDDGSSFDDAEPLPPPAPQLPPSRKPTPSVALPVVSKPLAMSPPVPPPVLVQPASPPVPAPTDLATARPSVLSPRTPPRHASRRRPLASSSSRSYMRRTSTFASRTSAETPPKPPLEPVKPVEPVEPVSKGTKTSSGTSSSGSLAKLVPMPARRPRVVVVVDDAQLDKELESQGVGEEDDDMNQRFEAFLKKRGEEIRLQRQASLQRQRRP